MHPSIPDLVVTVKVWDNGDQWETAVAWQTPRGPVPWDALVIAVQAFVDQVNEEVGEATA